MAHPCIGSSSSALSTSMSSVPWRRSLRSFTNLFLSIDERKRNRCSFRLSRGGGDIIRLPQRTCCAPSLSVGRGCAREPASAALLYVAGAGATVDGDVRCSGRGSPGAATVGPRFPLPHDFHSSVRGAALRLADSRSATLGTAVRRPAANRVGVDPTPPCGGSVMLLRSETGLSARASPCTQFTW